MKAALPGSSDPTAQEIAQLHQWCDHAQALHRIESLDRADEHGCIQGILGIKHQHRDEQRFVDPVCLGKGSYGIVFSVRDKQHPESRFAVKILRPSKQSDCIATERFEEESRILARLHHPHILKLYSSGYVHSLPYMVLELADAQTLAYILNNAQKPVPQRQSVLMISQIAEALQELHSNALVHRDIKPSNILIRRHSDQGEYQTQIWPLLSDFGLSKRLLANAGSPLTLQGEVLGTLAYMSPEQIQGEPIKTQSDLFSLGVILYELVYGVHPFLSSSDFQTRTNIVHSAPIRPAVKNRSVPRALEAILKQCLEKQPTNRYRNASDLANDLNCFLKGESVSVAPPTTWQSLSQLVVTHPVLSTFLGTALLSMLGTIALLSREWSVQRGLARTTQALADGRAEVMDLFIQSMQVTNSDMNDLILAGGRVAPDELLGSLQKQIPLLEKSHALAPDNLELQYHLQILLHYASICYNSSKQHDKAIEARKRSIDLIEDLLNKSFSEKLLMARINGAYWMGKCFLDAGRIEEGIGWFQKSVEYSSAIPKSHEDYWKAVETVCGVRFELAKAVQIRSLSDSIPRYIDTATFSLTAYRTAPNLPGCLNYAINSLSRAGDALVATGKFDEAEAIDKQVEGVLSEAKDLLLHDWPLQSYFFNYWLSRYQVLLNSQRYEQAEKIADAWDRLMAIIPIGKDENKLLWYRLASDAPPLVSTYFRFVAIDSSPSKTPFEKEQVQQEIAKTILAAHATSSSDMEVFVHGLQDFQLPTAKLEQIIEKTLSPKK